MLGNKRAGALLNDLLMSPLYRTLSLTEMDSVTKSIAKDLDLDMMALGIEFLNEDTRIFEQILPTRLHGRKRFLHFFYRLTSC